MSPGQKTAEWVCILLVVTLAVTGCSNDPLNRLEMSLPGVTFQVPADESAQREDFSFLIFTDLHHGRKEKGVYRKDEVLLGWIADTIEAHTFDFALYLGDGTSYSTELEYQAFHDFLDEAFGIEGAQKLPFYATVGNHDVRDGGRGFFTRYIGQPTAQSFTHKSLSFYLLDSGNASLGKPQLDAFMEASSTDPNPKIVATHFPLYSGPGLIYFAFKDPLERALLIQTLVENKVGVYLSGHLHISNKVHAYTPTLTEIVCESSHGRESLFENSPATWYVAYYDADDHTLTIRKYTVAKDETEPKDVHVATLQLPD